MPVSWTPAHFKPSFLPAAKRLSASLRRFVLVSSRLADSIQPMYIRRYEGANCSKYRRARGFVLNARSMYGEITEAEGRGASPLRFVGASLNPAASNSPRA